MVSDKPRTQQRIYESPVGQLVLVSDKVGENLVAVHGPRFKYAPEDCGDNEDKSAPNLALDATAQWLDQYFAGQKPSINALPLAPSGTKFQMLVWQMLQQIPYGETTTYGELAEQAARHLGKEQMAAQAVGGAVGRNPISIIIPCHRVVGRDGSLTGYAGGLPLKESLLRLEGWSGLTV